MTDMDAVVQTDGIREHTYFVLQSILLHGRVWPENINFISDRSRVSDTRNENLYTSTHPVL